VGAIPARDRRDRDGRLVAIEWHKADARSQIASGHGLGEVLEIHALTLNRTSSKPIKESTIR
jgi:hypothetical protein